PQFNDDEYVFAINGQQELRLSNNLGITPVKKVVFQGLGGNDQFTNLTNIASLAYGGAGHDTLFGGRGSDTMDRGRGNELLVGDGNLLNGAKDFIFGDNGNQPRADYSVLDGNDTLGGGYGDDEVDGEGGNDLAYGNAGNDTIHGSLGNDTVYGGAGDDDLFG